MRNTHLAVVSHLQVDNSRIPSILNAFHVFYAIKAIP